MPICTDDNLQGLSFLYGEGLLRKNWTSELRVRVRLVSWRAEPLPYSSTERGRLV